MSGIAWYCYCIDTDSFKMRKAAKQVRKHVGCRARFNGMRAVRNPRIADKHNWNVVLIALCRRGLDQLSIEIRRRRGSHAAKYAQHTCTRSGAYGCGHIAV